MLSMRMTRTPTRITPTSVMVPPSLTQIAPFLRLAEEIHMENPRIAYLCRFRAFEKAHRMEPTSNDPAVLQFKTYWLDRLQKEEQETGPNSPMQAKTDAREIQKFYQNFCEDNIRQAQRTKTKEQMDDIYHRATLLYDVLRLIVPNGKIDQETGNYAREVERNIQHYEHNSSFVCCWPLEFTKLL